MLTECSLGSYCKKTTESGPHFICYADMPKPHPDPIVQLALKEQLSTVSDASNSEQHAQAPEPQDTAASPMHGPNQLPAETALPGFQGAMCRLHIGEMMCRIYRLFTVLEQMVLT